MAFLSPHKVTLLKLLSLFSLIRAYNIVVLIAAQYLTARYILSQELNWTTLLLDPYFFCIVLATAFSTAAGYIINNFYDAAKDQINRPRKYILEHILSQKVHLAMYLLLNLGALLCASFLSLKAFLFFLFYIFSIGIYSTVIKRLFWLSNLFSALLMILPFWAITLYFKNFEALIFYHASYLFLLLFARDIVKDLENFKGDWVQSYQTLPVVFDHRVTKGICIVILLLCFIPATLLWKKDIGYMNYYFMLSIPYLIAVSFVLMFAQSQKAYLWVHNLIKLWILVGVVSIALSGQNI
ncbi:MAG: geranylgeranylglycerol-phosphate geranylgeranyltransferase [Flavobacteriaceae bacterium]|jgi:4-hydroxybenzoate polyprenyltransferase